MEHHEFYKPVSAKLYNHSPIIFLEIAIRECHNSFDKMQINYYNIINNRSGLLNGIIKDNVLIRNCVEELNKMLLDYDIPSSFFNDTVSTHAYKDDGYEMLKNDSLYKKYHAELVTLLLDTAGVNLTEVFVPNISFIKKVIFGEHHESIAEHANFTFRLRFPRNVLQELSRHRIGVSPSVRSTRYTMNEGIKLYEKTTVALDIECDRIILVDNFKKWFYDNCGIANEELCLTQYRNFTDSLDTLSDSGIELTQDIVKNILPEHWFTSGTYTMNLRALSNLFRLRLMGKHVFQPFANLAVKIYEELPDDYKKLFDEIEISDNYKKFH